MPTRGPRRLRPLAALLLAAVPLAAARAESPCLDARYRVYEVPRQGRFCIERKLDDFIKNRLRRGEIWEPWVLEAIEKHARPGSVAVDVGAHIGTHTVTMARAVGAAGRVIAFEPQRKLHAELLVNLKLNGVENATVYRLALGSERGTLELNPTTRHNEGGTGVGKGGEVVEMRSLDSFELEEVSLVKIDVEHAEDSVLEGARRTIAKNRPVLVVEIMGGYDYDTAPAGVRKRIEATLERIVGMGYELARLSPYDYLARPGS